MSKILVVKQKGRFSCDFVVGIGLQSLRPILQREFDATVLRVDLIALLTLRSLDQHSLWFSRLQSGMLRVPMRVSCWRRLEGHGTKWTFIEDLAVCRLDVRLQGCDIGKNHTTVDTANGWRQDRE